MNKRDDDELRRSVEGILLWLDGPELHLGKETRRAKLEAIILLNMQSAISAARDDERASVRRERAKDFLLIIAVLSALGTAISFLRAWAW